MNDLKSYATRRLREAGLTGEDERIWTRHGSTRYLNTQRSLDEASEYVLYRQGEFLEPRPFIGSAEPLPHGRGSLTSDGDVGSTNELRFFPERYAKTFQNWHENIRDWCISRQLWWGHRIPVWSRRRDITSDTTAGELHLKSLDGVDITSQAAMIEGSEELFICVPPGASHVEQILEQLGYRQDPDVLDTWFSSALWPLSTLGWPDDTAEMRKWNPTSVLCTAREIITLWVSRMVMFNLFFTDPRQSQIANRKSQIPFKHVFIHAMIQDGEGRKMSKSLGNGVDPLDIIASHGTDAMRFTLASMATNTQDVRMPVVKDETTGKNTSPKFDLGRGFCNKLWSIARFVFMSIEGIEPEPIDELKWSMADRWIVSRLNRTIAEVNDALADYRFDQYARAVYAFVENDFSGWYVEFAKPQLRDEKQKRQTAAVLASVMDASLRLLHPAIPFITEKLWETLHAIRPERGLPGRIACPSAPRIIRAQWPIAGDTLEAAEHIFPRVQDLVTAIRNLRSEHKVEPKRAITLHIKAPDDRARQIELLKPAIEQTTTSRIASLSDDLAEPAGSTKLMTAGCEVYVEGLVDESAEQARIAKRRDELTRQIAAMEGRLANAGYIAKAPPKLVQETKDQLAAAKAELASLGQ